MGVADYIILAIIAFAICLAVRRAVRKRASGGGCGCSSDCAGCAASLFAIQLNQLTEVALALVEAQQMPAPALDKVRLPIPIPAAIVHDRGR